MHESNAWVNEPTCQLNEVIDDSSRYTDELMNGVHESIKEISHRNDELMAQCRRIMNHKSLWVPACW